MVQYLNKHFSGKGQVAKTVRRAQENPGACKKNGVSWRASFCPCDTWRQTSQFQYFLKVYPIFGGSSDSEFQQPGFTLFQLKWNVKCQCI